MDRLMRMKKENMCQSGPYLSKHTQSRRPSLSLAGSWTQNIGCLTLSTSIETGFSAFSDSVATTVPVGRCLSLCKLTVVRSMQPNPARCTASSSIPFRVLRNGFLSATMNGLLRRSCVPQLAVESDQIRARQPLGVRSVTRQDKKLLSPRKVMKLCQGANMSSFLAHCNSFFVELVEGELNQFHEFAEAYGLTFLKARTATIV